MSWFQNSPLRASFGSRRRQSSSSPPKDCDPTACYNSFREHWQQTSAIIDRTQPPGSYPIQDDVLAVVNHLDQMVTLLLLELRGGLGSAGMGVGAEQRCLDFLLCENLLERLLDWSVHTGRFCNLLRAEQLKLYELLACQARQQLLLHQPFLRPLLRLLASCLGECFPTDVEDRLVVLLNQLCVCLMHNTELLQLFFQTTAPDQGPARFIIFSLLIPFVHREGALGQQARDALLLCMSLSKQHEGVGRYIAESNVCPVLAMGLGGLYSALPRKLAVQAEDWHRLTPDDVKDIEELATFMNSLEFCNAVAQVAHPNVRQQLLDYLYQGFLVPVLGPALLQITTEELVATTAYLDLFVRSVTEPGLLRMLVRFLLRDEYDGVRILNKLVERIASRTRLGLVSLALFDSLVALCCEDVMLELVFRHLVPCTHVMLSQRRRVRDVDAYGRSAEKFLSLAPACCLPAAPLHVHGHPHAHTQVHVAVPVAPTSVPPLPLHHYRRSASEQQLCSLPSTLYGLRVTESLYGNYHAYLCDARHCIAECVRACRYWTYHYDGEDPPCEGPSPPPAAAAATTNGTGSSGAASLSGGSSGYESLAPRCGSADSDGEPAPSPAPAPASASASAPAPASASAPAPPAPAPPVLAPAHAPAPAPDPAPAPVPAPASDPAPVPVPVHAPAPVSLLPPIELASEALSLSNTSVPAKRDSYLNRFNSTPDIGLFLDVLLGRLQDFHRNGLYVNLQLTGLLSRLACFPQPLLHSFLLNQSLVFQPSIRSLFQVLGTLKHKTDAFLSEHSGVDELVAQAQDFLVGREERLANARRHAVEASSLSNSRRSSSSTCVGDPFARGETKRRSFSSTLSSVFRRATQPSSGPLPIRESRLEVAGGDAVRFFPQRMGDGRVRRPEVEDVVLQAVLLDEWLKELAAITQEQALAGEAREP